MVTALTLFGYTLLDAPWELVTLLTHVEPADNHHSQIPFCRAAESYVSA